MATIQISDALAVALEQIADRLGKSKEDLASEAVERLVQEQAAAISNFTPQQIERMHKSVAQLRNGEVVTSEEVDLFFEDWQKELAAG
jgi:predicted transcriptional regulator